MSHNHKELLVKIDEDNKEDSNEDHDEEHDDRLVPPDAELVPFEDVGVGSWFIC